MANVVSVCETWSRSNSTITQDQGVNATSSTAVRGFLVQFDAADKTNQLAARSASGGGVSIPLIGDWFSSVYPNLRVRNKHSAPVGPLLYETVVEYAGEDSPLLKPWEMDWPVEKSSEEVSADANGVAYVDPLGLPQFGITRQITDRVYVLRRNEATNINFRARTWLDKVNSASVTLGSLSRPAGTVLMDTVVGTRKVEGTTYYYTVTYTMRIREAMFGIPANQVWYRRRLAFGNYYWDGVHYKIDGTKEVIPCVAQDGITYCPRKLRANGTLLPAGDPDVFIYTKEYEEVNFGSLNLI